MANKKEETGLDRREFLKAASLAGIGLAGYFAGSVSGCATIDTPKVDIASSLAAIKPEPVVYPKLAGNNVQAPENGCLIGFRKIYARSMPDSYKKEWMSNTRASESVDDIAKAFNDPKWDRTISGVIGDHIEYYNRNLGKKPQIFVMYETPKLFLDFPTKQANEVTARNVIPYLYFLPHWEHKPGIRVELRDIINRRHDKYLTKLAQGAVEFGKENGGFFVTTMHENIADWYYWGQNSNFTPAWRHVWQIFEDHGANQYSTWVWECATRATAPTRTKDPDVMYPGDKYVDWIGLSSFARKGHPSGNLTFGSLNYNAYEQMRKNHPDKRLMQAEFGKSQTWDQPTWLMDAFKTIKQMPGMKAAIFWDHNEPEERDDHTLSDRSLQTMKEIFKDPYFIMAR